MIVQNNTHYFSRFSRSKNFVPDPNSFGYQASKRIGYYQRLYWEFEYCKSVDGQCFYVTFTYNDKSIPLFKINDKLFPVFDYNHIRLITNGILSKKLSREYGSKLKYFCACESGEGKGIRGAGNNPHYHFIFFVLPDDSGNYEKIDPMEFLGLCQEIWQGKRGFCLWKFARFGSVKEGRDGIVVSGSGAGAFKYVGKYVIKDNHQLSIESDIRDQLFAKYISTEYDLINLYKYYDTFVSHHPGFSKRAYWKCLGFDEYFACLKLNPSLLYKDFIKSSSVLLPYAKYLEDYHRFFISDILPSLIDADFNKFLCQYSGKVRCSKSLGYYGLKFINNIESNPTFVINEKKGPKAYHPCLYYMRLLYYDVVKCPITGSPLYVLNDLGKKFKLESLNRNIGNYYHRTLDNISRFLDSNLKFWYKHDNFDTQIYAYRFRAVSDFLSIVYKYSVYHCVYQFRHFDKFDMIALDPEFSLDSIKRDYRIFLDQDFFHLDYDSGFVYRKCYDYDFSYLDNFKGYIDLFDFLDALNDYVDSYCSDIRKQEFIDSADYMKRMNAYQFNCLTI